jgi:uncharacterized protein (DUF1015 family)
MADVRPLPGIRYATGEQASQSSLAVLVTPPYDVISPEAQARYYERDPHNIIRLELGRDEPGDDELENRYTRAAATFAEWRMRGVMRQDAPSFYIYDQRFAVGGHEYTRRSLMARVRLEPWDAEVILPHERTLSKPKDDRLKLLRACAANLSPIMSFFDDPAAELASILNQHTANIKPDADFTDDADERHILWRVDAPDVAARIHDFFDTRQLYIADGHHRYETALAYRDEMAVARKEMPPDDPARFTMMALSAIEDPGLVVQPTHRILHSIPMERIERLDSKLASWFSVEPVLPEEAERTLATPHDGGAVFALVRPERTVLLRLAPAGQQAMATLGEPYAGASPAWRALDVAVLHALVLDQGLSVTEEDIRAGRFIRYTHAADEAIRAVQTGSEGAQIALLLRPTPPAAIRDVARARDRMPQKSTYFYPKLITGLVINPVW